jgi:hypothetical protein
MQKRQNWIYIFLFFLGLCVVIFLLFKSPIAKPIQSFTQLIFSPLTSFTHSVARVSESEKDSKEKSNSLDFTATCEC